MEAVPDKEESFETRRKIFKDIWDSSDANDSDDVVKPRVIKTARLSDHIIGNRKKRTKNLKTVCKKVLQLSDRKNYIQAEITAVVTTQPKRYKSRHVRRRKKIVKEIKSSSACSKNLPNLLMSEVTSERKNVVDETSRKPSLIAQREDIRENSKKNTKVTYLEGKKQTSTVKFYLKHPIQVQRELATMTTINLCM